MFVRVKTISQGGHRYEYLQIVRSVRDGARVQALARRGSVYRGEPSELRLNLDSNLAVPGAGSADIKKLD